MDASFLKATRICFLPLGDRNIASSRLRCYALQERLQRDGIHCQIGFNGKCDILYIQKKTDDTTINTAYLCKKRSKILIFDIDDFPESPIFRKNSELLASLADVVTTATPEQKSFLCKIFPWVNPAKVFCLPNPIDYGLTEPVKKRHTANKRLKVVWFGNIENFPGHLVEDICSMADLEFHAITNFSREIRERYPQCHFKEWTYDGFSQTISAFDVCVLSHQGNEIHSSKNANKMIAAIAHGLPVVASRTPDYERLADMAGGRRFLFQDRESLRSNLEKLRDSDIRNQYLELAQPLVWKHYNIDAVFPVFLDALHRGLNNQADDQPLETLTKLAAFHRRMLLRKGMDLIKSNLGPDDIRTR